MGRESPTLDVISTCSWIFILVLKFWNQMRSGTLTDRNWNAKNRIELTLKTTKEYLNNVTWTFKNHLAWIILKIETQSQTAWISNLHYSNFATRIASNLESFLREVFEYQAIGVTFLKSAFFGRSLMKMPAEFGFRIEGNGRSWTSMW